MIAVDSSVVIDYLAGVQSRTTDALDVALSRGLVCLSPVVVSELYSDPSARHEVEPFVRSALLLETTDDYWKAAGLLRAKVRKTGAKARLGDALIAQSAIDHALPLLTADKDFRHYVKAGGLKLLTLL